jgi:hypothetical protein
MGDDRDGIRARTTPEHTVGRVSENDRLSSSSSSGTQDLIADALRRRMVHAPYRGLFAQRFRGTPNSYQSYFESEKPLARDFRAALPMVTAFMNERILANEHTFAVTENELAVTYLAEGGDQNIAKSDADATAQGQFAVGTATMRFGDVRTLERWFPPGVVAAIDRERDQRQKDVRAGRPELTDREAAALADQDTFPVASDPRSEIPIMRFPQLFVSAVWYTSRKALADRDIQIATQEQKEMADLSLAEQFFWTTLYVNSGPSNGRKQLERHRLSPSDASWMETYGKPNNAHRQKIAGQSPQLAAKLGPYWGNSYYQALQRTAAFEELEERRPAASEEER